MLRGVFYDGSEAGLCRVVVTGGQGLGGSWLFRSVPQLCTSIVYLNCVPGRSTSVVNH
jgi:hypothetical protein